MANVETGEVPVYDPAKAEENALREYSKVLFMTGGGVGGKFSLDGSKTIVEKQTPNEIVKMRSKGGGFALNLGLNGALAVGRHMGLTAIQAYEVQATAQNVLAAGVAGAGLSLDLNYERQQIDRGEGPVIQPDELLYPKSWRRRMVEFTNKSVLGLSGGLVVADRRGFRGVSVKTPFAEIEADRGHVAGALTLGLQVFAFAYQRTKSGYIEMEEVEEGTGRYIMVAAENLETVTRNGTLMIAGGGGVLIGPAHEATIRFPEGKVDVQKISPQLLDDSPYRVIPATAS